MLSSRVTSTMPAISGITPAKTAPMLRVCLETRRTLPSGRAAA